LCKAFRDHLKICNYLNGLKSLARTVKHAKTKLLTVKERTLSPGIYKKGHSRVALSKDGILTSLTIHRLVALAFIPNPGNKRTVNHIDGNKQNNHKDNLEWSTYSENLKHALDTGLRAMPKGEGHCKAILTEKDVLEIRASKESHASLVKKYNTSKSSIWAIKARKNWKHI